MPRKVAFGRINRRAAGLEPRSFMEDFRELASRRETYADFRGTRWIAADIRFVHIKFERQEPFASGVLGFRETEEFREFESSAFSWIKGPTQEIQGASERTMVPFAIDLRPNNRWIGFATAKRIQPPSFAGAFGLILNAAARKAGKHMPSEWEVDLIVSAQRIEEFLLQHPGISKFKRTIRFHNPVDSIDDDRAEMRALGARVKSEEFVAHSRQSLNLSGNPVFETKLEGLDTGDLDVVLEAREGGTTIRFSSRDRADSTFIDDYGNDLEFGMELVLDAV